VPGAYLLASGSDGKSSFLFGSIFKPTQDNFMRLLKLAAILSPPIINTLIELVGTAPKGG
jgi:hypothetical protein